MTGDVTLSGSNFSVPPNGDLGGTTDYEFTGTIDGLGTGTLMFSDEWVTDLPSGGVATTIWVTGGTGDFAGLLGTGEILDPQVTDDGADELISGTVTFTLAEPVTVTAPYSGVRTTLEQLADGSISNNYIATTEGAIAGDIVGTGTTTITADCAGSNEYVFTGAIDGIGSGTLTYRDAWVSIGCVGGGATITVTITGGTGDFAGATGVGSTTVDSSETDGADDTVTGTNTFNLVVPEAG